MPGLSYRIENGPKDLASGHKYYVHCGHKSPKTFGRRKQTNEIKQEEKNKNKNGKRSQAGNKFNLCKLNWQIIGPEAGARAEKEVRGEEGPAMAIT